MTAIATPRAGQREWLGLAVLALACLLYAMDLTVLHLAVPSLSEDLRPSSVQLLWITDIYGFMVAGFLITMGTLGDRIGRRRLLLLGATAFGGVSVLAAFSTSPEMLIACRALLGIAGATLAPSTLSLIFAMFSDPRQRSTAIGVWITSYSAGGAGDGAAAGAGTARAAGVPRPRRWPTGPGQRGHVAGRGAGDGVWSQGDRPGRDRLASPLVTPGRAGGGCGLRAAPAWPGGPDDRPRVVSEPGVQRLVGDQPAWHLHRGRLLHLRRAVPAARAWAVAAGGRSVVAALGRRADRGVQRGSPDPAPRAPGLRHRRRPGACGRRPGVAHPSRRLG